MLFTSSDSFQVFYGKFVFSDMNSCRSQPCQNGGQCHNQGTSYYCQCMPGYYGNHCEHGKCWPDIVDNQTGYIGAVQNDRCLDDGKNKS